MLVASIWDLSPPVQKPSTPYTCPEDLSPPVQKPSTPYTCPEDLSPPAAAKSLQLCPTLCDPIGGSPPPAQLQTPSQLKNTQNIPPD